MNKGRKEELRKTQYAKDTIIWFMEQKHIKEVSDSNFEQSKQEFYHTMDMYYDKLKNEDDKVVVDIQGITEFDKSSITVTKVETKEVIWDMNKLKGKIKDEKQRELVFQKNFNVTDWTGLMALMMSAGIKFKQFKEYVDISESVRENQIDKLVDLGLLSEEDIKECATVKIKSRYYKMKEK